MAIDPTKIGTQKPTGQRMFEVFYNKVKIGLTAATDQTIATSATRLAGLCNLGVIDPKLLTWNDNNQNKYKHMM